MKDAFFDLAAALERELHANEILLCTLSGERSDFVRFNRARVRQAGTVEQRFFGIRLVRARRQTSARIALAGSADDFGVARDTMEKLREQLSQIPEDPWLAICEASHSACTGRRGRLPQAPEVIEEVVRSAADVDFVGFYAAGTICRGLTTSLGQRNWHEADTFSFDWSLHLDGARAVKEAYAGFDWDALQFQAKLADSLGQLELLRIPSVTLEPAEYRAYLAPRALEEIAGLLSWNAFSARARATRQSALLRMAHGERLSPKVTLTERIAEALAPPFQEDGFARPAEVVLIDRGALAQSLVSPRSAREYGLTSNGANARETPDALDLAPGELGEDDVLAALDCGLYIGNLWYLNYSDKAAARMTGMTRFATFLVEDGRIRAPVLPLRFDDTLYRLFGENLLHLTRGRELMPSTSTYDERSMASATLPGALVAAMRFTL
ncbi:MAG TPA: metallopeptidase TldD-related protein [Burkholderiales bacterium]|nr:metallopeptidase TldD-related protein [Burkholderiales bacterium]